MLTRGGLVDRSDGYRPSRTETHLALYVSRDPALIDHVVRVVRVAQQYELAA